MSALETCLAQTARLVSGASVRWVGAPSPPGPRIYFANHSSHLDFLVIWSALPKEQRTRTRPVAAADYWEAGRLRHYLGVRVANAVLVERSGNTLEQREAQIERMAVALDEGSALILFPEGTRGAGPEMAPFKSGLYYLASARPDVELVPVYVENLNRIWPKGELLPVPMRSCITFGPPIHLEAGESKDAFLVRARHSIESLQQA